MQINLWYHIHISTISLSTVRLSKRKTVRYNIVFRTTRSPSKSQQNAKQVDVAVEHKRYDTEVFLLEIQPQHWFPWPGFSLELFSLSSGSTMPLHPD
jgi:hypothetical protein